MKTNNVKRCGEDIVIRDKRSLPVARKIAAKLSKSHDHSWANIYYTDGPRRIVRETYCDGRYYEGTVTTGRDNCDDGYGHFWFSRHQTIAQAIESLR